MASEDFELFVASVNSALGGRGDLEAYDHGSLARLTGAEREEAETLLVDRIASGVNDPRAPGALLAMKAGGSVTDRLNALFPSLPVNETKVVVARLLFEFDRFHGAAGAVVSALDAATHDLTLANTAIAALEVMRHPDVDDDIDMALIRAASTHSDPAARINAELALKERNGDAAAARLLKDFGTDSPAPPPAIDFDKDAWLESLDDDEMSSGDAYQKLTAGRDSGTLNVVTIRTLARAIATDEPDALLDSALLLNGQAEAIRQAFFDEGRQYARTWYMLYGAELRETLGLQ